MTERERLIELVKDYHCHPEKTCKKLESIEDCVDCDYDEMGICNCFAKEADYLLDNGVIVFPCQKGDVLRYDNCDFVADHWNVLLTAFADDETSITGKRLHLFDVNGAEKALKEREYEK